MGWGLSFDTITIFIVLKVFLFDRLSPNLEIPAFFVTLIASIPISAVICSDSILLVWFYVPSFQFLSSKLLFIFSIILSTWEWRDTCGIVAAITYVFFVYLWWSSQPLWYVDCLYYSIESRLLHPILLLLLWGGFERTTGLDHTLASPLYVLFALTSILSIYTDLLSPTTALHLYSWVFS